jgi:hypothetical protein
MLLLLSIGHSLLSHKSQPEDIAHAIDTGEGHAHFAVQEATQHGLVDPRFLADGIDG